MSSDPTDNSPNDFTLESVKKKTAKQEYTIVNTFAIYPYFIEGLAFFNSTHMLVSQG